MIISSEDQKILSRVIKLLKSYYKAIILIVVFIIAASLLSLVSPQITKIIVDNGLVSYNIEVVIKYSIVGLLLVLTQKLIELFETKYCVLINSKLSYDLSKTAIKKLMRLKQDYFSKTNYAEIIGNLNLDISNISRVADKSSFYTLTSIFKVLGGFVGLILIDWRLALMVALSLPLRVLMVTVIYKIRRKLFEAFMEVNKEYSSWYGDTISGIKEIKLFGLYRLKIGQFIKHQRKIIKINIKTQLCDKVYEMSEDTLYNIITYLIYILGALLIRTSGLSIGSIFAFITYCSFVTAHVSVLLSITYSFSNIIPSAKRFFEFLDMDEEVGFKVAEAKKGVLTFKRNISFENVSYSYDGQRVVLKDLNLSIEKGERIAILGSNGSGKTTILNLLLRFLSPQNGRILLDGESIDDLKLSEYRQLISWVGQDLHIFNDSLQGNISLFPQSDLSRLERAASLSGVNEYIKNLPRGLKSNAGQNGAVLSAGQRQKLAMARALYSEAEILIFDEATSNYDSESEMKLSLLFDNELKDKTIIVVSHRPELLKSVERIVLIDGGEVIGNGNHDDLYGINPMYTELFDNWSKKNAS